MQMNDGDSSFASLMHTRTRPPTSTHPVPPSHYPPFPPPHIHLHPDDASSKVFLAIARAFVSVDNRAMTIKDIAERASRYGLVCQNLSATAQSITTYLRAHKTRCDKEQDQPLLLSHTLSGTPDDDDLVPALHSRSGGDSHPLENRLTNFRKGTAVWYLSRATGIPCPFTRAGIRLCDYRPPSDPTTAPPEQRTVGNERKSARVAVAGEKRKRPLRTPMTITGPDSENERPPKVKLTLRLKPLIRPPVAQPDTPPTPPPAVVEEPEGSTSTRPIDVSDAYDSDGGGDEEESDSMSIDSTSSSSDSEDDDDLTHTATLPMPNAPPWQPYGSPALELPSAEYSVQYLAALKRSPSLPFATPPPDSDDDMSEDYHVAMTRINDEEENDELGWDADLDSEGEEDINWDSPGPRSPSAPLLQSADQVTVKQEPQDVQGMLEAWEDFDTNAAVADVIAKALETTQPTIKTEPVDTWEWDASRYDTTIVKQEDFGVDLLFPPGSSSPATSLANQFPAFSYSDNPSDEEPSPALSRRRAKTVPAPSMVAPKLSRPSISSSGSPQIGTTLPNALSALLQTMSGEPGTPLPTSALGSSHFAPLHANTHGQGRLSLPTPCVSPLQTRCQPSFPENQVVVTTTQPSDPPVSATQIEDISVYQMMLCAFQLLRRIDTDWVNLSPIIALAGASPVDFLGSDTLTGAAVVITKGSPQVCGTWVPLAIAQQFVNRHSISLAAKTPSGDTSILAALAVFLSDNLVKLFPPALEEFHRTVTRAPLQQFGKHFASTLQATQWASESGIDLHVLSPTSSQCAGIESPYGPLSSLSPPPLSASSSVSGSPSPSEDGLAGTPLGLDTQQYILLGDKREHQEEVPLSAKEREIFHELCIIPDWERDSENGTCADGMAIDDPSSPCKLKTDTSRPPTPATARPAGLVLKKCSGHDSVYALSDESPLSSVLSSPTLSARGMASPPLSPTFSTALTSRLTAAVTPTTTTTTTNEGRPLRRSKRVADAATQRAPPPRTRARSRKRGPAAASRNSLS